MSFITTKIKKNEFISLFCNILEVGIVGKVDVVVSDFRYLIAPPHVASTPKFTSCSKILISSTS